MHVLAVGLWGAFFGTVAPRLTGGLVARAQSHRSIAMDAGMTGAHPAVFIADSLRLLPIAMKRLSAPPAGPRSSTAPR